MKKIKWIPAVFALLGIALVIGTVALSFSSLDAPARLLAADEAPADQTEKWIDAVCRGDYTAAGELMYGQPELHTGLEATNEMSEFFWDAFIDSISYEFYGGCRPTQSGLTREVTVTALDISAVMEPLRLRTEAVMERRIEELADMDQVYDENNNYRDTFVMDSLREAAQALLKEKKFLTTRSLTINLVLEDGQWWILAEQELINFLSGKMI